MAKQGIKDTAYNRFHGCKPADQNAFPVKR